jgi:hypothetical protein
VGVGGCFSRGKEEEGWREHRHDEATLHCAPAHLMHLHCLPCTASVLNGAPLPGTLQQLPSD